MCGPAWPLGLPPPHRPSCGQERVGQASLPVPDLRPGISCVSAVVPHLAAPLRRLTPWVLSVFQETGVLGSRRAGAVPAPALLRQTRPWRQGQGGGEARALAGRCFHQGWLVPWPEILGATVCLFRAERPGGKPRPPLGLRDLVGPGPLSALSRAQQDSLLSRGKGCPGWFPAPAHSGPPVAAAAG